MKILAIWDGMSGVAFHRLYTPYKHLQLNYDVEVCISQDFKREGLPYFSQFDVVVFNGWLGLQHYEIIHELARQGVPYVIDIDDYWKLPKFHPAYKFYREHNVKNSIIDAIKYADGVTTTTETLAACIRAINPRVKILPNALDTTEQMWNKPKKAGERLRFGYLAGETHSNDVELIGEAVGNILEKYNVEFQLIGYQQGNQYWESMLYKFNGYSNKMRVVTKPPVNVSEYGNYFTDMDCVLAPLEDTTFNNCKSELKILEAAAYELPVLASNCKPYLNHKNNIGVHLVSDWYEALDNFITGKLKLFGNGNRVYCEIHHDLDTINKKRFEFLCAIKDLNLHRTKGQ